MERILDKEPLNISVEINAPWLELRGGTQLSIVPIPEGVGTNIVRDAIIIKLKEALDGRLDIYEMNAGGATTINITRKGITKAGAIEDFIQENNLNRNFVFHFGDEYFNGGADASTVTVQGINCFAVCPYGRENNVLRIGEDYHTIGHLLKEIQPVISVASLPKEEGKSAFIGFNKDVLQGIADRNSFVNAKRKKISIRRLETFVSLIGRGENKILFGYEGRNNQKLKVLVSEALDRLRQGQMNFKISSGFGRLANV
jgi:hypothetical protein